MDVQAVIKTLTARRHELGLSQAALADKLGNHQNAIWQWESGKVMPRLDRLLNWIEALGLTLDITVDTSPPDL